MASANAMTIMTNPLVDLTVLMQRRKTQSIKVLLHQIIVTFQVITHLVQMINLVNQGSDAIDNIVTLQMITQVKVMKIMAIQMTTGQVLTLF